MLVVAMYKGQTSIESNSKKGQIQQEPNIAQLFSVELLRAWYVS
jgi:hypothetical protein